MAKRRAGLFASERRKKAATETGGKRKRGRPPGSKNKKPIGLAGVALRQELVEIGARLLALATREWT